MALRKTGSGGKTSRAKAKRPASPTEVAIAKGYRSGLEDKVAEELAAAGVTARYEEFKLPFRQPAKDRTYTPDYLLPNGIVVETKGRFLTDDRTKMKLVKAAHPDLDIRFVFSRSATPLTKVSKTTYGDWCLKNGFPFADKSVPQAWLDEPDDPKRIAAFHAVAIPTKKGTTT